MFLDDKIVGEVTTPDTLNYRTSKPEMKGLFNEKYLLLSLMGDFVIENIKVEVIKG